MSSFSSQWLANVIALRHYSSVIWDFIRGHTCVCSCDKWKDKENMKKHEILCGCAGVCCDCGCDCFIKWLSTEYWAWGSVLKMGCRDLNALMINANNSFFPRHYAILRYALAAEMESYAFACCFLHFYHHILYMAQQHRTVCLLRRTIPSRTAVVCKMTALQNGWKMLLMFPFCLTFSFFRVAFQLPIFIYNTSRRSVSPSALFDEIH